MQLLSFFEIFLIAYTVIRLLHSSFFFINVSLVAVIIHVGHCRDVSNEVTKVIAIARTHRRYHLNLPEVMKVVHFLNEHNAVCRLLEASNRALWSPVMASFVMTNIPLNIYALSQIVLSETKNFVELLVLALVLVIQLIAFIVTMMPLSYTCKRMHEPQFMIVALQAHLMGSRNILIKCKLDALKMLLSCGPKMAVTIGPAREVTEETMTEVS